MLRRPGFYLSFASWFSFFVLAWLIILKWIEVDWTIWLGLISFFVIAVLVSSTLHAQVQEESKPTIKIDPPKSGAK